MTGALVGAIDPPSGSAVTSTCSTPFSRPRWISTSALPFASVRKSAVVGAGSWFGRLSHTW